MTVSGFFFFGIDYCALRGAVPHVALLGMFTCLTVYVCTWVLSKRIYCVRYVTSDDAENAVPRSKALGVKNVRLSP